MSGKRKGRVGTVSVKRVIINELKVNLRCGEDRGTKGKEEP